jgi:diacylglycerol kinase
MGDPSPPAFSHNHGTTFPNHDPCPDLPCPRPSGASASVLLASFRCAFAGLWYAIRTQQNMRIHLSVAGAVIVLGIYLGLNWTQWAVLALTVGAVLIAEMFNTVAEAALDAATPYYQGRGRRRRAAHCIDRRLCGTHAPGAVVIEQDCGLADTVKESGFCATCNASLPTVA